IPTDFQAAGPLCGMEQPAQRRSKLETHLNLRPSNRPATSPRFQRSSASPLGEATYSSLPSRSYRLENPVLLQVTCVRLSCCPAQPASLNRLWKYASSASLPDAFLRDHSIRTPRRPVGNWMHYAMAPKCPLQLKIHRLLYL